jgi:hypothetical protein
MDTHDPLLTVTEVQARYRLRSKRAAYRLMHRIGAIRPVAGSAPIFVRLSAVLAHERSLEAGANAAADRSDPSPSPPPRRPGKPDVLAPDWWRYPDG